MSASSLTRQEQRSQDSYNILLIEDDESICEMITASIESESSFRVTSLSSGEEVLQRVQEIREVAPFLFIIDYLLPGMDGLQLFDHLQSVGIFKKVPTLMITASTITDDVKAALLDRSVTLLPKPFELSDLLDYLEYIHKNSLQQIL